MATFTVPAVLGGEIILGKPAHQGGALAELVREGLIDIMQQEPFAPIHVRAAQAERKLRVVADNEESGADRS